MKTEQCIKKHQNQNWLQVSPQGDLDMDSADELKREIKAGLMKSGTRMLWLNFTNVKFIDSSGLGVILGRYRELAPLGGRILISGCNEQVYRLLIAAGMHRIIRIDRPAGIKLAKEGIQ